MPLAPWVLRFFWDGKLSLGLSRNVFKGITSRGIRKICSLGTSGSRGLVFVFGLFCGSRWFKSPFQWFTCNVQSSVPF